MVVIGGVLSGLHMSPHVLQYDIIADTWETLVSGLFGPPGKATYLLLRDGFVSKVIGANEIITFEEEIMRREREGVGSFVAWSQISMHRYLPLTWALASLPRARMR